MSLNKSIFLLLCSLSSLQATKIINDTTEPLELYVNEWFSGESLGCVSLLKPGKSFENDDIKSFTVTASKAFSLRKPKTLTLRKVFTALSDSDEIRITSFAGFLVQK